MIQGLETKRIEATNPVGVKKTSNWKLPGKDFTYGLAGKTDKEDVPISKNKFYIILQKK